MEDDAGHPVHKLVADGAGEAVGEALDRQLNFCRPSQAVQMDF